MRGRVTLINSILNSIPIYWFSLGKIPISIINNLEKLIIRFLWSRTGLVDKIHLIKWDMIFIPRAGGGWVIRNPLSSNIALSLKCGWKTINSRGLWGILIMKKYLKDKYVEYWLSGYKPRTNNSFFWLSFMRQIN